MRSKPVTIQLEVTPAWWHDLAANLSPRAPDSMHQLFARAAAITLELQPCKRMVIERTSLHVCVVPDRSASLADLCEMADSIRERLNQLDVTCLGPYWTGRISP